jgi:hypothetical protein
MISVESKAETMGAPASVPANKGDGAPQLSKS